MAFGKNILMEELIQVHGAGYGTPLFNQQNEAPVKHENLPSWVWNGKEVSQEALRKFEKHLQEKEVEYLNAVLNLGGEATDNDVYEFKDKKWQNGFISARRNSLMKVGIIVSYGKKKMGPTGRVPNIIWSVNFKKLFMLTLD